MTNLFLGCQRTQTPLLTLKTSFSPPSLKHQTRNQAHHPNKMTLTAYSIPQIVSHISLTLYLCKVQISDFVPEVHDHENTADFDHEPMHVETPSPTNHPCHPDHMANPPLNPPPEPRITRKRARDQALVESIHPQTDEVANAPLTTHITSPPLAPIRRSTRNRRPDQKLAHPTPQTHTRTKPPINSLTKTSPHATSGRKTCKPDVPQKTSVAKANLPALLRKYLIHEWLKPFILDLHEVDSDGHCGFRAIAASIGRPQGDWLYVRQSLINTLEQWPNIFTDSTLPYDRAALLNRLRTEEPNVLSLVEHWLTMPGIGGVIATTFDRPVLYYEPGIYSQVAFPYLTAINDNPPIVLVWANRHFACLTLDYEHEQLPVPRLCKVWIRYRSPIASTWLPAWKPRIDQHSAFLVTQNKRKGTRKKPVTVIVDGSDD